MTPSPPGLPARLAQRSMSPRPRRHAQGHWERARQRRATHGGPHHRRAGKCAYRERTSTPSPQGDTARCSPGDEACTEGTENVGDITSLLSANRKDLDNRCPRHRIHPTSKGSGFPTVPCSTFPVLRAGIRSGCLRPTRHLKGTPMPWGRSGKRRWCGAPPSGCGTDYPPGSVCHVTVSPRRDRRVHAALLPGNTWGQFSL